MRFLFILFAALVFSHAQAESPAAGINAAASAYQFKTSADARRFSSLTKEIRCVMCQFQNIAESNAPIAESMRNKIYQLINDRKSDNEIRSYLVKRYGEVILLKPRFNAATAILWFFPLFGITAFIIFLYRFFRSTT